MEYRIEIWQYHGMTTFYESNDIEDILEWYRQNWSQCYELGNCTFDVYKDGEGLSWNEEHELGFYD